MEKIVLIGNGGHAKSIIDTIETVGEYEIAGFIAEQENLEFEYRGYKIIGTDDKLKQIYESGIHKAFVCIGYMGIGNVREIIYEKIKKIGFKVPTIIDSTAIIAKDVYVGEGTYVGKKVVINSSSEIGKMAIINTGAIIEHDCVVGDFSHVAVGGVLCGEVHVKKNVLIGANATILQGIYVGKYSRIGAGSVVVKDVLNGCTVVGIPGKMRK